MYLIASVLMVTKINFLQSITEQSSCQPVVIIMLNQSSYGGMPATSALLQGFPNNAGLVRTLLPGHHHQHPNVSLGLEVRPNND